MALSSIGTGPDKGTLLLLPLLREATSFLMLRPFLEDVPAADFCGAYPGKGQELNSRWHSKLLTGLVPIPAMEPGDMVFWHPDLVHAVQSTHLGNEDSSVFYIPAFPKCPLNDAYVQRQAHLFLSGRTPPDFPSNDSEVDFVDRATIDDLSPLGREMMGLSSEALKNRRSKL